jgi:hypothetical protein
MPASRLPGLAPAIAHREGFTISKRRWRGSASSLPKSGESLVRTRSTLPTGIGHGH